MKTPFEIFVAILVLWASPVLGQNDWWNCDATMPGAEGIDVVLFVLPDATGSTFSRAQIRDDGTFIDAHIELIVRDGNNDPIPNMPAEDIWLESFDFGMVSCLNGTCPDADTDQGGFTFWEKPLNAGGGSEANLAIMILGNAILSFFPMAIVSPDMNGDGVVNLADVGIFSSAFHNEYAFEADFFSDGVLNLADVGRLAAGVGGSCP